MRGSPVPHYFLYNSYEEEFLAHSYKHINTRLIDGLVDLSKLIVLIKADRRSLLQQTTTACLLESVCLAKSNPTIALLTLIVELWFKDCAMVYTEN